MTLQDAQNAGYISTHTLTWSVTMADMALMEQKMNFNSHAHVERDAYALLAGCSVLTFQLTRSRGA